MVINQIYSHNEQLRQGKIQNVQFEEKKSTRKWNEAMSCAQGEKQLKKTMILNRIKGVVTSEQDTTQLSFQLVKRN